MVRKLRHFFILVEQSIGNKKGSTKKVHFSTDETEQISDACEVEKNPKKTSNRKVKGQDESGESKASKSRSRKKAEPIIAETTVSSEDLTFDKVKSTSSISSETSSQVTSTRISKRRSSKSDSSNQTNTSSSKNFIRLASPESGSSLMYRNMFKSKLFIPGLDIYLFYVIFKLFYCLLIFVLF